MWRHGRSGMPTRRSREQLLSGQNFIDPNGDPRGTLMTEGESPAESSGEARLMLAVLEDAIMCYQRYCLPTSRKAKRLFFEAEAYIFAVGDRWPYSFVNCCHELRLEPGYLREGLRRWKEQRHANTITAPPKIRRRARPAITASKTRIKPIRPKRLRKKVS